MYLLLAGIVCILAVVVIALFLIMRSRKKFAAILATLIAVSGVGLYFYWSDAYYNFVTLVDEVHNRQMLAEFESHLMSNSGSAQDWSLLARMYRLGEYYEDSLNAYEQGEKSGELTPEDKISYAEIRFLLLGETFDQKTVSLLNEALAVAPNNERGLWLSGFASFVNEDYQSAADRWSYLRRNMTDGSEVAVELDKQIADARQKLRANGGAVEPPQPKPSDVVNTAMITVSVTVADSLRDRISANDTLFIYALAASGPPMPLAIKRLMAGDLPVRVTLGATDAMMPAMTLGHFDPVKVIARISKSGMAKQEAGDLYGESAAVSPSARPTVSIEIEGVIGEHD